MFPIHISKCSYTLGERSRRGALKAGPGGGPKGMSFIVRQHRFLAYETSIWSRLTASKAVNYHSHHVTKTCPSIDLRIRVVCCHEILGQLSLIPVDGVS